MTDDVQGTDMSAGQKVTENRGIAAGLRQSGVPEFVFTTTLVKESQPELREMIATSAYRHNGQLYGFYLFTQRTTSVTMARRVFYLIAKELFLSGVTVYCTSLADLNDTLGDGEYTSASAGVHSAEVVFVTDFYEDGSACPLDPAEASRVRAWVRSKFERGQAVSFLGDMPLDRCSAWWPSSFLRFIAEHTLPKQL